MPIGQYLLFPMLQQNVDLGDEKRFGVGELELFGELEFRGVLVNGWSFPGLDRCCHLGLMIESLM